MLRIETLKHFLTRLVDKYNMVLQFEHGVFFVFFQLKWSVIIKGSKLFTHGHLPAPAVVVVVEIFRVVVVVVV